MAEAYDRLGMPKLAQDTRRVLEYNFPERVHVKAPPR